MSTIWTYEPAGKDINGRRVYRAYLLGAFAGYRHRRSKREREKIRKEKYFGAAVGIPEWVPVPEWMLGKWRRRH